MNLLKDKNFMLFVIKFIVVFLLAYYGTVAVIGITSPGRSYSSFVENYLNYPNWIRHSLLYGSKFLLSIFDIDTYITNDFHLRIPSKRGVFMSYSCIGYGVMSFWIAYVFASYGTFYKKLTWWLLGLIIIWLINITRVSLLLVAINRNWASPFGMDHHDLFNIVAYIAIFVLIYFFEKASGRKSNEKMKSPGLTQKEV